MSSDSARPTLDEGTRAGLCADCAHTQRIVSSHGTVFYRCLRADTDPTFRKYPPLPVTACAGYVRREVAPGPPGS